MRFSSLNLRGAVILPMLAAAALFAPGARAGWLTEVRPKNTPAPEVEKGQKIEFSAPDVSVAASVSNVTANLAPTSTQLNPAPSAFKQMQDDLFRPLVNSIKGIDSTEGVIAMPIAPPRAAPDRRTKEAIERKKNWAFTDLNDLYPDPTLEESLGVKEYGADGKEKKALTPVEKYYNSLGQQQGQGRNQWGGASDPTEGRSGSSLSGLINPATQSFPGADQFTKSLFSTSRDSDAPDVAGVDFTPPSIADANSPEMKAAKKQREEFDRILDPTLPPAVAATSLTASLLDPPHASDILKAPDTTANAEPHRSVINPMLGIMDPNVAALHNRVYDDLTSATLGTAPVAPVSVVAPRPRNAETVREMLDPYTASVMKPKF